MLKEAGRPHPHEEKSDDRSVLRNSRRSQNRTIRACSRSRRRQLLGISVRSSSHLHSGPTAPTRNTMGVVVVAALAASAGGVPVAAIIALLPELGKMSPQNRSPPSSASHHMTSTA